MRGNQSMERKLKFHEYLKTPLGRLSLNYEMEKRKMKASKKALQEVSRNSSLVRSVTNKKKNPKSNPIFHHNTTTDRISDHHHFSGVTTSSKRPFQEMERFIGENPSSQEEIKET